MTIKQEVEQLLSRNVCVCCYRVEILNCAFKPHKTYEYSFDGNLAEVWKVDPRYPVELTYDVTDTRKITVKWLKPTSGQFELTYGEYNKTIVVQSLF